MTSWKLGVVCCDLVLALVINTSAMLLSHAPISFAAWYPGTSSAFFTNVLLQLVLPVPFIGQTLSKPFENKKFRWVFSVFVENLIFITFISLTMAAIQHGTLPLFDFWLATYPYLLFIGYVTSLVLFVASNRERFFGKTG